MSRPTCPCGHDRHHDRVQPILRLGLVRRLAWLAVGGSEAFTPRAVRFVCRACDADVEVTRDAAVRQAYRRWPYVDRPALRAADR